MIINISCGCFFCSIIMTIEDYRCHKGKLDHTLFYVRQFRIFRRFYLLAAETIRILSVSYCFRLNKRIKRISAQKFLQTLIFQPIAFLLRESELPFRANFLNWCKSKLPFKMVREVKTTYCSRLRESGLPIA